MRTLPLSLLLCIASFAQSFPTSVYTPLVAKDNISTTLLTSMLSGDAVAIVASSTGWTANMVAYICDSTTSTFKCTGSFEAMLVTGVATNVLTVTRGYGGTSAIAHASGKAVLNAPVAIYNKTPNDEVLAIEHYLFNNQARRAGTVMVYPPVAESGVGIVVAPDGSLVSTSGSVTSGLQEAEDYRYAHGYDMHITGGNEPSGCSPGPTCGAVVYNITANGLRFHPMQGVHISSGAITINCTTAVGSNPCVKFDSAEMLTFSLPGSQIVTFGTGPCMSFVPTNQVGNDSAFTGFFGKVYLQACANLHTPATDILTVPNIKFDSTTASITYSTFEIIEVLGGGIGVEVVDPPSGKSFAFNRSYFNFVHDQVGGAAPVFKLGATNTGRITNNYWSAYFGGNTSNTGKTVSTFGLYDIFERLVVSYSGGTYGLYWETGAAGGQAITGQVAGSTQQPNGIAVGGDCSKNSITTMQAAGPFAYAITPAASPWTFQNTTCQPLNFVLSGGTVSAIVYSTTGSNSFPTGMTTGTFHLKAGEYLVVTYSGTPTVTGIL